MAKGKNKLNKTNSSGWLDNYSEELSINEYQDGGKLKQYFNLPTKRVAVDNTYNKNSPKLDSSDDKEMVNRLLREKANESQKAKEKRIADVRRLEELNQKSMLETANAKDLYDIGEGMKSKYRFSNEDNFFDDYINPFNIVGGMAGRLAQTPELINQGEYGNAALALAAPLGVGAIGSIGANTAKQFLNNTFNPVAASHITHTPSLVMAKIATKKTLQNQGAPTYQRGGKVEDKKSTLSKLKKALSLKENLGNLDTKEGYFTPLNQLLRTAVGIEGKDYSNEPMEPLAREQDALRMYLGLPSKTGAFEQTAPNKYRIRDYNKLYPDTLLSDEAVRDWGVPNEDGVPDPVNPAFDLYPYDDFVMGKHYITKGKDAKGEYLKYSDRFDFDPTRYANQFIDRNVNPTIGKYLKKATPLLDELESLMFNPFELEDKIYYDPKTKLRSDIILQQNASKVYPGQPMAVPAEFQNGGRLKIKKNSIEKEYNNIKNNLKNLDNNLQNILIPREYLNLVYETAKNEDELFDNKLNTGERNGYLDALRHSTTSALLAKNLPNLPLVNKFSPIDKAYRMGVANILGAAHEFNNYSNTKELLSDLENNYIGSEIGANAQTNLEIPTKTYNYLKNAKLNVINRPSQSKLISPNTFMVGDFKQGGKINDDNGYLISNLDNFTPKKVINSNYITTNNMAFPVAANGVVLYPNTGDYIFPTDKVTEIPIMKNGGQHGGLDRWFAEKWVDVKTGKECGRQKGEKRKGYPACRPSKRINSDTPKTASELSSAEKEKFKREKTSSKRIDYSHKKEDGGLIYNDMKNKFKKYQGGGYLNYQDAYKGFGVGPQLSQDNSYFRSVMPTNIENMEEEINKPSVFSGINDVLGSVNQGVSQVTGLMSQFSQPTMRGNNVMPDISNWQAPLSGGKTDEQLNFENDQALKNAGLFDYYYPNQNTTTGSTMGPSINSSTWKGVPFINKYGGYLRKYQNGGNMDMLPVGYPEYIHKSNVFHENYNPVPRVHFSDDTTPYDMGVNLNDLVNMYGGRVGKYQYGGMMPFYSRQRSPRIFNSNANRASLADLESAYENDFMHTKVRKDRQSFEDDKVDWGFMDWAKEPVGAYLGMMSTVPIIGDISQDIVGDSFLTRTGGYTVGKGVGNVTSGAAKVIGGAATGNVGMIGSGIGDVGEGVGSTVGTFQAKDALSNYDKSGYVSGNRLVRSSQDFGNMMDTASGLFGNIKGGVGMVKNMGGLKGMLGNMKGGATGMKGIGNIIGKITGFGQDGGYIDYDFNNIEEYKYGGQVSQKINKKQNKTGWLDQL